MKKRICASVAVIILMLSLCSCNGGRASNQGYKLYRSSPVGVSIEYPDFWEVADDNNERTVAFVTPSEGYGDEYRDNVSVCSSELDGEDDMAFDNYVKGYIQKLPTSISGYNFVSEGEVEVPGYDAYRVVYEGSAEGENGLRIQQTFIKSGRFVYIYSFIAESKSFDYFGKNADIMLSTFKALRK